MKSIYRRGQGQRHQDEKLIKFFFNQKPYYGFQGDSVLTALLANGIFHTSYSPVYQRATRFDFNHTEPLLVNVLQVGQDKNAKPSFIPMPAEELEIFENLQIQSFNLPSFWKGISRNFFATNPHKQDKKSLTFKEAHFFNIMLAKLGVSNRIPLSVQNDLGICVQYIKKYHHTDLHVIGGNVYGMYAALLAANAGLKVMITDKKSSLMPLKATDSVWDSVAHGLHQAVTHHQNITILPHMQVLPVGKDLDVYAISANRHLHLQRLPHETVSVTAFCAKHTLIATDLIDYPFLFAGHDKPGIMTAATYLRLYQEYGMTLRQNIVLYLNHDSMYDLITACHFIPDDIVAIIDTRPELSEKARGFSQKGYKIYLNSEITLAMGAMSVEKISVQQKIDQRVMNHSFHTQTVIQSAGKQIDIEIFAHYHDTLKPSEKGLWYFEKTALTPDMNVIGYGMGQTSPSGCFSEIFKTMQTVLEKWHKTLDFKESVAEKMIHLKPINTVHNIVTIPKKHLDKVFILQDMSLYTARELGLHVKESDSIIQKMRDILGRYDAFDGVAFDQSLLWHFCCLFAEDQGWNAQDLQKNFIALWCYLYESSQLACLEKAIQALKISNILQTPFLEAYRHKKTRCRYQSRFMLPENPEESVKIKTEALYQKLKQDFILRDLTPCLQVHHLKGADAPMVLEEIFDVSLIDMPMSTMRQVSHVMNEEKQNFMIVHVKKNEYILLTQSHSPQIIKTCLTQMMQKNQSFKAVLCDMSFQYAGLHLIGKKSLTALESLRLVFPAGKQTTDAGDHRVQQAWFGNIELLAIPYDVYGHDSVICLMPSDAASSLLIKIHPENERFETQICLDDFVHMLCLESGDLQHPYQEHHSFKTLMCVHPLSQKDMLAVDMPLYATPTDHKIIGTLVDVCYSPKYQKMIGYALIEGDVHEWENRTIYAHNHMTTHKINIKLINPNQIFQHQKEENYA